jgi:hypothetical protein
MEDAKAALVAGGAIVDEYDSVPDAIERKNLLRLERHLDLTSLEAILASIAEDDDLPSHAETARALVSYALHTIATGSRSKAALAKEYLAMVCAAAPGWSAHRRDMLRLVTARLAHGEKGKQQKALLELLERLPPAESPQVRAQIERWVPQKAAASKRAPSGAARPKLFVEKATRRLLGDGFEAAANGLSAHFDLKDWPGRAPSESATSIAKAAADALEGVVLSSDTDCPYLPIVLEGPDPATEGFVEALGVEPSAIDVVASGKAARGFGALTLLSASELENADDYLSTAEQKALSSAAKVLGGTVNGVRLRMDDGSRVLLALGKASEGGYPGVLAVSIET